MKKLNLFNFTLVKSFNLNLFRCAAMVAVLLMLGVGNAWA